MKNSIMDTIKNRIESAKEGTIFVTSDFLDLANKTTVRQCLGRLVKANVIRRVMDGVYEKPKYSSSLNEFISTDPDLIAKTIANIYHWTISPSDDVALNKLGLSTQEPTVWSYISDGPYREYTFNGITISFKHRTNRNISKMSDSSSLVIEALRTLGKDQVDDRVINTLKEKLSKKEKDLLLKESLNTSEWIYKTIRKVCD